MVYKGITITEKIYNNFNNGDIVISKGGLKDFPKDMACPIIRFYPDNGGISGVIIKDMSGNEVRINKGSLMDYFKAPLLDDAVEHPSHYSWLKEKCGIEVIDITRHLDFNRGNIVKYVLRAGHKSEKGMSGLQKEIQDLEKAEFYIKDEIKLLKDRYARGSMETSK